jgi:hypothetical protein
MNFTEKGEKIREFAEIGKLSLLELGRVPRKGAGEVTYSDVFIRFLQGIAQSLC